jgi:hypothetical protein
LVQFHVDKSLAKLIHEVANVTIVLIQPITITIPIQHDPILNTNHLAINYVTKTTHHDKFVIAQIVKSIGVKRIYYFGL